MIKKITATLGIAALTLGISHADEGMWTFDNIPSKQIKAKYGFEPSKQWLDNIRLSSVRFNDGGSGAFISSTGLVITNHHVASKQLQKMSSSENDYLKNGFYAKDQDKEAKCTDLELNVLVNMENVTDRIGKAVKGLPKTEAIKAQKAEIAAIEKENSKKTGLRSEIVSLYNGGEYWLYSYKQYRDVRLVMAPEKQIAFYGGSHDNFTYPRYDLDFAIFRVYENGKPLNSKNYIKFSDERPKEGELIFVSGHPGKTRRNITYSQYLFNRDFIYPANLYRYDKCLEALYAYADTSEEARRRSETLIFSYENGKKATTGEFKGLTDPTFSANFELKEKNFRNIIKDPEMKRTTEQAYENVNKVLKKYSKNYEQFYFGQLQGNRLPSIAMNIARYVKEIKKPDSERKNGFHDSQLDRFRYINLSKEPIYKDLEKVMLQTWLEMSLEKLGENDDAVKILLDGQTPSDRAEYLIRTTKLNDVSIREELLSGGLKACEASEDPLIMLALKMEPIVTQYEKWVQSEYESAMIPALEKIAETKFSIYGKNIYPDATFTLRMAYGPILRYDMNGTQAPPFTTFYGLYDRRYSFKNTEEPAWELPKTYLEKKNSLDLSVPLNFVYDADTIGGNSGSPVINTKGELLGINFDRNIEGLIRQFVYDGRYSRSIAVSSVAVIESLRNIYDAEKLADEIMR